MQAREYQQNAIDNLRNFFKSGGLHCILEAPTGAGKTFIFSLIAKAISDRGKKVLILTDRAELLLQTGGSLIGVGLNVFFIQAGIKYYSTNFNVYLAMSQTFRRRIKDEYWQELIMSIDLIIIDEAHKQEFNYLFESCLIDNKRVVGFTATPRRSGKMRQLALDYEQIISTVSVKWLIDNDYLVNDDLYSVDGIDIEGIEIDRMKGDLKTSSMFKKFNNSKLYSGVVENYRELVPGTKTLVFCVNIEHTIKTAEEFIKKGINAKYIVSKLSQPKKLDFFIGNDKEYSESENAEIERYNDRLRVYELYKSTFSKLSGNRKDIFKQHQNNEFDILVNAGIATTGYDDKSLETIILNRATISTALYLQMIGRGSRIYKNKTHFNILDFGGNAKRLGEYSEERTWSLWHEKTEGNGIPPIKSCGFDSDGMPIHGGARIEKGCNRPILASYSICPFCGFKYPSKKVNDIELKITKNTKSIKSMNYTELHDYWKIKKHKSAWLWRQLWYKGRSHSIKEFGKIYNWTPATINKAIGFCNKIIK